MGAITSTVIAAAGVGNSIIQGSRARRDARNAQQQEADFRRQQMDLGREQLAEGNRRYGQWESLFMPGFEALRDQAMAQQRPDYEAIDADVGMAFDTSQAMNRRQMDRYGVRPTDGAAAASEREYGLGRALGVVGGRQNARRAAAQDQWSRLAGFANSGNMLYGGSNSMIQAAYGGINSALGGAAGSAMGQAANAQNAAGGWMRDAAGWAGFGVDQWNNRGSTSGLSAMMPTSPRAPVGGGLNLPTNPIGRLPVNMPIGG